MDPDEYRQLRGIYWKTYYFEQTNGNFTLKKVGDLEVQ